MRVLLRVLIGWWAVPLGWAVMFPIGWLLMGLDEAIEGTRDFSRFMWYGEE